MMIWVMMEILSEVENLNLEIGETEKKKNYVTKTSCGFNGLC